MAFEQGLCALENVEDFLLCGIHRATVNCLLPKNKPFSASKIIYYNRTTLNSCPQIPVALEDELGDVLDKAIVLAGLTPELAAERAGVDEMRLRDALDWRSDLDCGELTRLAGVLGLNDVGLCALAQNHYPLPAIEGLPFCLYPLRMPHGIGVVNAYLVSECGSDCALLFDTGPGWVALRASWPHSIKRIKAVFLSHHEAEHAGGLAGLLGEIPVDAVYCPQEELAPDGSLCVREDTPWSDGRFLVQPVSTPGHAASHFGYRVSVPAARKGRELFISGDLLFAGTVGGAFFCPQRLRQSLRRVLEVLPGDVVLAPGHGPLTTLANEKRYNPFIV